MVRRVPRTGSDVAQCQGCAGVSNGSDVAYHTLGQASEDEGGRAKVPGGQLLAQATEAEGDL